MKKWNYFIAGLLGVLGILILIFPAFSASFICSASLPKSAARSDGESIISIVSYPFVSHIVPYMIRNAIVVFYRLKPPL